MFCASLQVQYHEQGVSARLIHTSAEVSLVMMLFNPREQAHRTYDAALSNPITPFKRGTTTAPADSKVESLNIILFHPHGSRVQVLRNLGREQEPGGGKIILY